MMDRAGKKNKVAILTTQNRDQMKMAMDRDGLRDGLRNGLMSNEGFKMFLVLDNILDIISSP